MVSDAQILKTQTCFLQEMVQKERIQPRTFDFTLLVPFCLYLVDTRGEGSDTFIDTLHFIYVTTHFIYILENYSRHKLFKLK